MLARWHKSGWVLVAVLAIAAIFVLMLAPQAHSGAAIAWLPVLLILFVGVIAPLSLLSPMVWLQLGSQPQAPLRAVSFQRPPPFRHS